MLLGSCQPQRLRVRCVCNSAPKLACSNAPRRVNFQIPGTLYFFQAYIDFVVLQRKTRITKPADMLPHPPKPLSNGAAAVELFPAATFDVHASELCTGAALAEVTGRLPADGLASQTSRAQGGG